MFRGLECVVIQHFNKVVQHLSGQALLPLHPPKKFIDHVSDTFEYSKDFLDIIGHEQAKRALEIAVAGEHNVFNELP